MLGVLYLRSKQRFAWEEAFHLLFRRPGGCERNVELAQVIGRSQAAISKMYTVVLAHVYQHAMRLEIWEHDLVAFA